MRNFLPGDKVFTIQEEVDLFHPLQVGRVHHWITDRRVSVTLDTGGQLRTEADELSLIPELETKVILHPGPTSFNTGPYFAIFKDGVLHTGDQKTPYRRDLNLSRWQAGNVKGSGHRRACDIFSSDGVMVREGDIIRRAAIRWIVAVVLWDYSKAGWSLHEITPDRFRRGVEWDLAPASSNFGEIIGNVWAVPPMETGIPEEAEVVPSYKIIKARKL